MYIFDHRPLLSNKDMVERVFGPVSSLDSEGVAGGCNPAATRPQCGPAAVTRRRPRDHPAVGRQRRPGCGPSAATIRLWAGSGDPAAGRPAVATRRRPGCPAAATNRLRAGSGDPAAGRRRRPSGCGPAAATRLRADWLLRVRATRSELPDPALGIDIENDIEKKSSKLRVLIKTTIQKRHRKKV
jgi:hypothetical protein